MTGKDGEHDEPEVDMAFGTTTGQELHHQDNKLFNVGARDLDDSLPELTEQSALEASAIMITLSEGGDVGEDLEFHNMPNRGGVNPTSSNHN